VAGGLEIFVYGRDGEDPERVKFPARQTLEASKTIISQHQLDPKFSLLFKQTRRAIDAGVFHNDVVCVGHENVLLIHEAAWELQHIALRQIEDLFQFVSNDPLYVLQISEREVPLKDAVSSYLFNSQIVTLPDGSMALIAPIEAQTHERVRAAIDRIISESNPISKVHYVDVRQSMRNGGGPACLRLRVTLSEEERAAMHSDVLLTNELYASLKDWILRHYRESLTPEDLADPQLLNESRAALDELSKLLNIGNVYSFQS
jgi:succinylarginine dihydrolase